MRLWWLSISIAVAASAQDGQRQFEARCTGCHGEDGTGGAHGPSIVETSRPYRAPAREAIRSLILNGTPDAGMPAFRISEAQADAIAAYVLTLRQPAPPPETEAANAAPAAPSCGEHTCAQCHIIPRWGVIGSLQFRKYVR
jgi:mono/diheme cytochrome c family protein